MGRKKKPKTYIKSFRVDKDLKCFLDSLDNANLFVIQVLKDTDEFKKYCSLNKDDKTPKLF